MKLKQRCAILYSLIDQFVNDSVNDILCTRKQNIVKLNNIDFIKKYKTL